MIPEHKRVYYRHVQTGDRGYMVKVNGIDHIQLDRANQEIIRPFKAQEWSVDRDYRPLTKFHVAQIAYEADKRLCFYLGLHMQASKEWIDLTEDKRIKLLNEGPVDPPIRALLWEAITSELDPISE